eukprot:2917936-Pyramimonas_sp.AAC.1
MLGKPFNPALKLKGGETRDFFPFAMALLREFVGDLGARGRLFVAAGDQMSEFLRCVKSESRTMPHSARIALM